MSGDNCDDDVAKKSRAKIEGRPHHKRFVLLAEIFEADGAVDTEPEHRDVRRPDLRFGAHVQPVIFKPLHHLTLDRVTLGEHFGSWLSASARKRVMSMTLTETDKFHRWERSGRKEHSYFAGSRPPLTVVISPARPVLLEQQHILRPMPEIPGVWCGRRDFAELLYVWVHGLADDEPGWDLIRLAFPPGPTISDETYLRFFLDPANSNRKKQQLMETMMANEIAVPKNEDSWERFLAMQQRGLEEGRQEGRQEGLEEGREAGLFTVASEFMSNDQLDAIRQLKLHEDRIKRLESAIRERLSK